tara:strand:+ start:3557 stop:6400 length:2844 start_codon:yes stop_codon:yes gene_type:complete
MPIDLLNKVQPATGWYAIVGIKGKRVQQELVATREEVDVLVAKFLKQERDVYFGVAKYATDKDRTKDNVERIQAFWLDIDCGPKKAEVDPKTGRPDGYATQAEGLQELRKFCKTIGLPKPIVVNSGRGLHVYWPLTEDINPQAWEPVAERLRELCNIHELYVDAAVFETARILRVPGTLNFKDNPPTPVAVLNDAEPIALDAFSKILGVSEAKPRAPKRKLTALAKSLIPNTVSVFSKIMRKSAKGNGCAQLLDCFNNRETLAEPRWFDALSIAKFCEDRDTAIHKLSQDHVDYDYDSTESKTQHIKGPHSCEQFEQNNPGGCEGCPFRGKITSPISLSKEVPEAEDNKVVATSFSDIEGEEETLEYLIPDYPFPFFRGKGGGVFIKPDGDEVDPIKVYDHDFYVVKRMHDPNAGDVIVIRAHMPRDGVKEFVIPNIHIVEKRELRKDLAMQGIMASSDKTFALLAMYITMSIRELQHKRSAEKMRTQFGWADNDSKFIIGDQEISKDGVYHSPPSTATANLANFMGPKGTLEKWKEVFNLYGKPGLEPHAFAALTAFGSPLLKFTGQQGAILNVIHPNSGTGKTTILHMCNSVIGHPERLCAIKEDTANAKIIHLGLMNNLAFTVDEITNMKPEDFSNLAYCMSQGRGKNKSERFSNTLKLNLISWQSLCLCSGNAAFTEKMASYKASADGELMRLVEYKIDQSDILEPAFAKEMFDHQLKDNYGHAGVIYAQWLVNNLEEARNLVATIQTKIDREMSLTPRERFWSAVLASNIAGGLIAKKLNLIDWDMKAIYEWATSMVIGMREDVKPPATNNVAVMGDYINMHIQNILVVNDQADLRTKMQQLPVLEPRGELLIRYEPDTQRVYVAVSAFKKYCVKYQINYKETIRQLTKAGVFIGAANKRLSKGMSIVSPAVHCIILDASVEDFMDIDSMVGVEKEEENESR